VCVCKGGLGSNSILGRPVALVTKPWRGDISGMVEVGREKGISSHEEGLQHWLFLWHGGSGNIKIVVCLMAHLQVLQESCRISEMRLGSGALQGHLGSGFSGLRLRWWF
jgi:hypothetical protein